MARIFRDASGELQFRDGAREPGSDYEVSPRVPGMLNGYFGCCSSWMEMYQTMQILLQEGRTHARYGDAIRVAELNQRAAV
jgi:hypothetical protein